MTMLLPPHTPLSALRQGFSGSDIIFDSPCKSLSEIMFTLKSGVHLNIDNLQELERVSTVVAELEKHGPYSTATYSTATSVKRTQ